jgi:hypothetical protein
MLGDTNGDFKRKLLGKTEEKVRGYRSVALSHYCGNGYAFCVMISRKLGLGVINRYRHGENRGRTLYCFHTLPEDQRELTVHTEALTLIRKELDALKPTDPEQLKKFPKFVFLLLAETSDFEELRSVIVTVLLTRFKHERTRTGHAASQ